MKPKEIVNSKGEKTRVTLGDCIEMWDFLSKKDINPTKLRGQELYNEAVKNGYKEGPFFGKIISSEKSHNWGKYIRILSIINFILFIILFLILYFKYYK